MTSDFTERQFLLERCSSGAGRVPAAIYELSCSDGPAHDGGHIKWPPVRAELAINLSRCPRSPGGCRGLAVARGSLFGTGLTDTFRNLPPSLYRVSIKSRGQKTANMSTDTLLVAVISTTFKVI